MIDYSRKNKKQLSASAMLLWLSINYPKYKYNHEIVIPSKLILSMCAMCMPIVLAAFYIVLIR